MECDEDGRDKLGPLRHDIHHRHFPGHVLSDGPKARPDVEEGVQTRDESSILLNRFGQE